MNLPAFRDNQRQAAIEGEQLRHFVQTGLDDLLPAGSIDATRVRRAGHSLGSVTTNLGVSFSPGDWESVFLSGSGGVFTHYALDTGLLDSFDSTLLDSLFGIVGAPVPTTRTSRPSSAPSSGSPRSPGTTWTATTRPSCSSSGRWTPATP